VADRPDTLRAGGFGREAEDAIERRRRWPMRQGLEKERDGRTVYADQPVVLWSQIDACSIRKLP